MRKSRTEAAKTRERIVTAAAAEFRQHGIAATGLADLMKAAGLTHGGFYRHFASKDQLVAEACSAAIATMTERVASSASRERGRKGLEAAVATTSRRSTGTTPATAARWPRSGAKWRGPTRRRGPPQRPGS